MDKILTGGFLTGKKTYITTIVGMITAIASYFVGGLPLPELIQTVFPLAGILFLRKGMNSKKTFLKRKRHSERLPLLRKVFFCLLREQRLGASILMLIPSFFFIPSDF